MDLIPAEILAQMPPLFTGSQLAYIRFYAPWKDWAFFACEYSPESRMFFGYADTPQGSWCYCGAVDLVRVQGPHGLGLRRDETFEPQLVRPRVH